MLGESHESVIVTFILGVDVVFMLGEFSESIPLEVRRSYCDYSFSNSFAANPFFNSVAENSLSYSFFPKKSITPSLTTDDQMIKSDAFGI